MPQPLGGIGQPLPLPQNLYPSYLAGDPYDLSTNQIGLAGAESIYIPAGHWFVNPGTVCIIQFLDPITGTWIGSKSLGSGQLEYLWSDGGNVRVLNPTGTAGTATVTAAGSGYNQATVAVSSSDGVSQWQAVVGGALALGSITAGGAGYTRPPLVIIPAPPNPGVPAVAVAVLTAGAVTGITLITAGAGYLTPPVPAILPSPFETGVITPATATLTLTGAGTVTAVLLKNTSGQIATAPTLTITGGSGATATAALLAGAAANDTIILQPAP